MSCCFALYLETLALCFFIYFPEPGRVFSGLILALEKGHSGAWIPHFIFVWHHVFYHTGCCCDKPRVFRVHRAAGAELKG